MKLVETPGGVNVFLSNREFKMWEGLSNEQCKADLSEREQHVAQELVRKGVVKRSIREKKTYYSRIKSSLGECGNH